MKRHPLSISPSMLLPHWLNVLLLSLLLFLTTEIVPSAAFLVPSESELAIRSTQRYHPYLIYIQNPNKSDGGDKDSKWSFQGISFQHTIDEDLLTTGYKRRKEVELQLLEHLKKSDEAIDPLIDLWSSENREGALVFERMEEFCSPGLKQEEVTLRQIIDDSEREWAEPIVRLALLLFVKRKYLDSLYWCEKALNIKPWHFEAGRLMVVLYLRLGEFGQALQVARRYLLPALNDRTNNKRRTAWVNEVKNKALQILQEAEMMASTKRQDEYLDVDECPVDDGRTLCWE